LRASTAAVVAELTATVGEAAIAAVIPMIAAIENPIMRALDHRNPNAGEPDLRDPNARALVARNGLDVHDSDARKPTARSRRSSPLPMRSSPR
jgi:hypothetical protein